MVQAGERYVTPSGVEMVVTRGGDGDLTDGDTLLQKKGDGSGFDGIRPDPDSPTLSLGRRFQSPNGDVMVLITKAGLCDLRYNGDSMEVQQPRKLPSSD